MLDEREEIITLATGYKVSADFCSIKQEGKEGRKHKDSLSENK